MSEGSGDPSLREYLWQAIQASRSECREGLRHLEESVAVAEANSKETVKIALESIDRRFDGVNEFRGALGDLSSHMATKNELASIADKMITADKGLEARFDALYQRNRRDIELINQRIDRREGQALGSRITTGILITVITVAVGVIGMVVVLANYLSNR